MKCEKLFGIIDSLNEKYIKIWEDVCNIESPTAFKEGVDAVGNYFIELARERGWQVEVMEHETAGNAILITLNPDANAESVTFSGHIDTVHPLGLFGSPAVKMDDENIYGPGVLDCKGGVVASFLAMDALERCGFEARPINLIIQSDEETSSKTSGKQTINFMCDKAKDSIAFLNTEGIQGTTAVLTRKGIVRYKFSIHGRAEHSARCYDGASAIAEAAHKILELEKMKDKSGVTCNCGVINGGSVPNTVPAECTFLADVRFPDKESYERVIETLNSVAQHSHIEGCSCDLELISYRPAMPFSEKNNELLATLNCIFEENGLPVLTPRFGPGGSDAAYITEAGIPCVDSVGVSGKNIHSINEFASLSSLAESAKRLAAVAYCI